MVQRAVRKGDRLLTPVKQRGRECGPRGARTIEGLRQHDQGRELGSAASSPAAAKQRSHRRTNDLRRRHATITREVAASSESEVIAQQLSALGARISRLEARLAEVDPVIARLEGAALTTARSMQEISQHWDAVYEAMRRGEQPGESSSQGDAHRSPRHEPDKSATDDAS
jgi:uncharacterized coiled-coil protein SlyX